MANSKATWDDVSKKVVYISKSPRTTRRAGETVYTTTTTSSSSASPRAASPSRVRHEVFDDDESYTETMRQSVVSPSGVEMEPRSARSVVKKSVVQGGRSRSSSPVREIIREIHHYDNNAGTAVNEEVQEVRQVVNSRAGAATKKVTKVHNYETAQPAAATEKVQEIHHYMNDAPAAAVEKRVSEVHQYAKPAAVVEEVRKEAAPAKATVGLREIVREIHHYDQTPRPTNNVMSSTVKEVKETSRAVSPPAKANITKEIRKETKVVRGNNHYNDANGSVRQTTRAVHKASNANNNLKNTNVNTHTMIVNENVNEKVNLSQASSVNNVNSSKSVYRDASPERSSGCCGKSSKKSSNNSSSSHYNSSVNHSTNRVDDYSSSSKHIHNQHHSSAYTGAAAGADIGRRRCCAACLGLLGLLLLGGLIAGLYFGIKAAIAKSKSNSAVNQFNQGYYDSGYYVNGVYVIPITVYDSQIYLIYGNDVPCNKYNNNTDTTDETPNCVDLTTSIAVANWTTTISSVVNANSVVINNDGCRPEASPVYGIIALGLILPTLIGLRFQITT